MAEQIDKAIAIVLKQLREQKKLSQEQLSFQADLHRTYISQLERGVKSITLKTLLKITTALNIDIVDFIKMVKDETQKL
jgi:transcriptional regulator with XRE-family HTH domain